MEKAKATKQEPVDAPIEDLMKQCSSVYQLVVVAAKRAKELAEGAPALVHTTTKKATSVALEEIRHGKITYAQEEVEETGEGEAKAKKRKRSTTATEKKRS